jgi:DNA-directed RNA polymerase specialized sigma24 family protein
VTIDRLRRQHSQKRFAPTQSLDDDQLVEEIRDVRDPQTGPYTSGLAEIDVIKILERAFPGKNSKRNILIFLLHFREGLTPQEISRIAAFDLRPSSIAHILIRMREKIREAMFVEKS